MIKLLLATLLVYVLPGKIWLPEGVSFFLYMTTWSLAFITYLHLHDDKINTYLIAIESFSISLNFIGCLCYLSSLKSIYIYEHRPTIITACFITELVIILGARLQYVGANDIIHTLRDRFLDLCSDSYGYLRSICSASEPISCKTQ